MQCRSIALSVLTLFVFSCDQDKPTAPSETEGSAKSQAESSTVASQDLVCFDSNVINSIIDILSSPPSRSSSSGDDSSSGDTSSGNLTFEYEQLTFDGNSLQPAWSPDGQEIVFTKDDGTYVDVYVMDSEGNILRQLTTDGNSSDPSWRADGERIYFVSDGDIYSVNPDGTDKQLIVSDGRNPSTRYRDSTEGISYNTHYSFLAFSFDGSIFMKVVTRYVLTSTDFYRMTAKDNSTYDYQPEFNPISPFYQAGASHTYDIVFTRRTLIADGDDTWNIHIVDQDHVEQQLTFDDDSWGPTWSSTGRYIAFASSPDAGWDIYVMEPNGANRRQITFDGNAYQPTWHPNERRIAFTSSGNIYTVQFSPEQR